MTSDSPAAVDGTVDAPAPESFERAVIYTPQAGDVVVIEVGTVITYGNADALKATAAKAFGLDVKVVVLVGAYFAGVVRKGDLHDQ